MLKFSNALLTTMQMIANTETSRNRYWIEPCAKANNNSGSVRTVAWTAGGPMSWNKPVARLPAADRPVSSHSSAFFDGAAWIDVNRCDVSPTLFSIGSPAVFLPGPIQRILNSVGFPARLADERAQPIGSGIKVRERGQSRRLKLAALLPRSLDAQPIDRCPLAEVHAGVLSDLGDASHHVGNIVEHLV